MSTKNSKKTISKTSQEIPIEEFQCNRQCKKTPSRENCVVCCLNYLKNLDTVSPEDEELSFTEKLQKEDDSLDKVNYLFFMCNQMMDAILNRKKKLLAEYEKKVTEDKRSFEIQDITVETIPQKEKSLISIQGFINVTAKKLGYFFFGENNDNGLRLPRIEMEKTIAFIRENYSNEEGVIFSVRSLNDGFIEGIHMAKDKKFQK